MDTILETNNLINIVELYFYKGNAQTCPVYFPTFKPSKLFPQFKGKQERENRKALVFNHIIITFIMMQ